MNLTTEILDQPFDNAKLVAVTLAIKDQSDDWHLNLNGAQCVRLAKRAITAYMRTK